MGHPPGELLRFQSVTFLERALLDSADRECRRIGQELHDHLCQYLLGAAFATKALADSLPPDSPAGVEAGKLARLINSAVQQARNTARGLHPMGLDAAGLMDALRVLTQRPHCRLECEKPVRLPDAETAHHAYRIAQEALANALKHSAAREIVVRLSEDDETILLQIADDGRGFQRGPDTPKSIGIESMKIRARALGGMLCIDTPKDGGTSVTCALPKRK